MNTWSANVKFIHRPRAGTV